MSGHPRNNLHEQLAAKSKSGAAAGSAGLTARSAARQAGLAREMSGIGQYSKTTFNYACEGSARVPNGNKKQPISLQSSTSSSSYVSAPPPRQTASTRQVAHAGSFAPSRQASSNPTHKGKERARPFESVQPEGSGAVQQDDSGFAEVSCSAKRLKLSSADASGTRLPELQRRLTEQRLSRDKVVEMMQRAIQSGDTGTAQAMSVALNALKKELDNLEHAVTALTSLNSRGNVTNGQPSQREGPARTVSNAQQARNNASATATRDEFDDMDWDDVNLDALPSVRPASAQTGRKPLQIAKTSALPPGGSTKIVKPTSQALNPSRGNGPPTYKVPVRTVAADPEELEQYPWSVDVRKALRQRFRLQDFRPNQLKAINATLAGKDVFVLMPTGGGKSMCYQLPAVVTTGKTRGVTVVVSPLISLIVDQVTALINKGITAVTLNSHMDAEDREFAYAQLEASEPTARLVYVTPELLGKSGKFLKVLERLHARKRLARFVIDEAHCVSRWGHDLRPDYKNLSWCKETYPDIPVMALTATANQRVKADVKSILRLDKNCVTLSQSFNRSNLYYEIRKKGGQTLTDLAKFIKEEHDGECGIVYCLSRANCEETADKLRREHGVAAMHYHAALDKGDRQRVQLAWLKGDVKVICATIAFGMGIDKPDVRYVVHYSLPSSLEGYYQETGRAGRDGLPSTCVLYYAFSDFRRQERMIRESKTAQPDQKVAQCEILRKVLYYCLNIADCRRAQVLQYFGENFDPAQCKQTCDNCRVNGNNVSETVDVTGHAKNILSLVEGMTGSNVTIAHVVDVYYGSKAKKIANLKHDRLPQAGKGSEMLKVDLERLVTMLLGAQLLGEWEKPNAMGFTNSYLMVNKSVVHSYRWPLTMTMSKRGSKFKAAKTQAADAAPSVKPKPKPLQRNRPVASGRQDFVDEENVEDHEADDEIQSDEEVSQEEDDDGITIASDSTRSLDVSGSRSEDEYGDETDHTFKESDNDDDGSNSTHASSSDDASDGDDDLVELRNGCARRDSIEVVHSVGDASADEDSDVELVPTKAQFPKQKSNASTRKGKGQAVTADHSFDVDVKGIRKHTIMDLFMDLQEIAQQAFTEDDLPYEPSMDSLLERIAEKRCQSELYIAPSAINATSPLSVHSAGFSDFQKIKGWNEEMYDRFGRNFKAAIAKAIRREALKIEKMRADAAALKQGTSGESSAPNPNKQSASRTKDVESRSSTPRSKKSGPGTISKFFAKNEAKVPTKGKAKTKAGSKKTTSSSSAAALREAYTSKSNEAPRRSSRAAGR